MDVSSENTVPMSERHCFKLCKEKSHSTSDFSTINFFEFNNVKAGASLITQMSNAELFLGQNQMQSKIVTTLQLSVGGARKWTVCVIFYEYYRNSFSKFVSSPVFKNIYKNN